MAAALRLYSLTEYLRGTPFPMLGVAAVAVAPFARRQGVAGELCRQALVLGRKRGDLISVLYPFRPDFYARLGWALVGSLHSFRFPPTALRVAETGADVQLADAAGRDAAEACYARVAAQSHGLIERSARVWEQHLGSGDRHLFVLPAANRQAAGYLLVQYGRSRRPADRSLLVHELIAETPMAYRELLGWIARQADQWAAVRYDALPEEHLDLLLSDPRPPRFRGARTLWAPVALRIRGPMLRVLDVPAALQRRAKWPAAESFAFTLRVADGELPENQGPWLVGFDGVAVSCAPAAAALASAADIVMGAGAFAQVFAGELRPSDAVRLGLASSTLAGAELARVDALFHTGRTFRLLDEF
jgi:predicted acetyltransferase